MVAYGMTLRELLRACTFDDIAEVICKDERSAGSVEGYREAYDILLNMEPWDEQPYDILVTLYHGYQCEELKAPLLYAHHLEGCKWQEYIDGHIYVVENAVFTKEQLAFRIMWHLTFYGFSPEDQEEYGRMSLRNTGHDTEYGRKAAQIRMKRDMLLANSRIRKAIRDSIAWFKEADGENNYALPEEDWNYLEYRRQHCNRMKRMRDHRLAMQEEKLWKLDEKVYWENRKKQKEKKNESQTKD